MTREEFKFRRKNLGMTQQELAYKLDRGLRTIKYYEANGTDKTIDLAMEMLEFRAQNLYPVPHTAKSPLGHN